MLLQSNSAFYEFIYQTLKKNYSVNLRQHLPYTHHSVHGYFSDSSTILKLIRHFTALVSAMLILNYFIFKTFSNLKKSEYLSINKFLKHSLKSLEVLA